LVFTKFHLVSSRKWTKSFALHQYCRYLSAGSLQSSELSRRFDVELLDEEVDEGERNDDGNKYWTWVKVVKRFFFFVPVRPWQAFSA
jgi:hypothetical protein